MPYKDEAKRREAWKQARDKSTTITIRVTHEEKERLGSLIPEGTSRNAYIKEKILGDTDPRDGDTDPINNTKSSDTDPRDGDTLKANRFWIAIFKRAAVTFRAEFLKLLEPEEREEIRQIEGGLSHAG